MITNGTNSAGRGAPAVVHDIRGRLRVRIPHGTNSRGFREAVVRMEGVTACEWSPRTRSLLVRYQPEHTAPDTVLEVIGHHAGVPATRPRAVTPGEPVFASAVRDVVANMDGRVARWTGGALDLAALLPLSLTLWALKEIMRGQMAPLAWSTALWYAHGLFRDYSLPASPLLRSEE